MSVYPLNTSNVMRKQQSCSYRQRITEQNQCCHPFRLQGFAGEKRIIKIAINNGLVRNHSFMDYKYITAPIVPKSLTDEDGVKWIHFNRKKTGTPCHIPVLELPLQLIEKYRGLAKEEKLFPMISCRKTNIYLKRIATECKINKPITFHAVRHKTYFF